MAAIRNGSQIRLQSPAPDTSAPASRHTHKASKPARKRMLRTATSTSPSQSPQTQAGTSPRSGKQTFSPNQYHQLHALSSVAPHRQQIGALNLAECQCRGFQCRTAQLQLRSGRVVVEVLQILELFA